MCVYRYAEDSAAQHSSNLVHAPVAVEKELQRVQSLLASHEEAYETQCAAMNKLQLQMNEIAEIQHAAIKQFHQHMKEIAEIRTATMKQLQLQKELSAKGHFAAETNNGIRSDAEDPHGHCHQQGLEVHHQEIHHSFRETSGDPESSLPKTDC